MCQCHNMKFTVDMTLNIWQPRESWLECVAEKHGQQVADKCSQLIGAGEFAPKNPSQIIEQALKDVTS